MYRNTFFLAVSSCGWWQRAPGFPVHGALGICPSAGHFAPVRRSLCAPLPRWPNDYGPRVHRYPRAHAPHHIPSLFLTVPWYFCQNLCEQCNINNRGHENTTTWAWIWWIEWWNQVHAFQCPTKAVEYSQIPICYKKMQKKLVKLVHDVVSVNNLPRNWGFKKFGLRIHAY